MDCKFQLGDAVVCVDELTEMERQVIDHPGPVLDEVYHVSELVEATHWQTDEPMGIGVRLREIQIPEIRGKNPCFKHTMFRRLITPEQFMQKDAGQPVDSVDKVTERV